jgi:hypothetical protein
VQAYVVALGLDPVDLLRPDEDAAVARGHHQPLQVAAPPAHLLQQRPQPAVQVASRLLADPLARAVQRRLEALVVEGLQQVVQRLRLEGAQGELVVGGDEDHYGHTAGADRPEHVEAVDLRHLDVQEEQVRRRLLDHPDRFPAVRALGDDLHVPGLREQAADAPARQRLVVHDHGADRHADLSSTAAPPRRKGRAILTTTPPSG